MPHYLALDTSTEYLSLALSGTAEGVTVRDWHVGQRHAELTLPSIEQLLADTGVSRKDIAGIAFGMGPGSFTGLRIGCGIAQGLAFGLSVPILGVSTLLALAEQCPAERAYACLDARMNQVYSAAWQRDANGQWQEAIAATVCDPDAVPVPDDAGWTVLGSGFAAYADALNTRLAGKISQHIAERFPHAREILKLAAPQFDAGKGLPADQAELLYLRDKVALKTHERVAKP
ncbi:tRNA threonylcarbamoyladenosine biosynthesis protein TsaB [Silvimonas terrae]|uniref:tRNA threonylcarbamoyladenosine biosynthesis protein TsaB n=1 Tax=Silvimonas terrae TaxID=300266 RepID=A0A840RMT5_9NEIS|nr:tRNA (adenosine(37)-N6)-threonylcarbamoyltransferase complex dimerization subunit type 1 TsaB [Silvimonas terrae]MBB5193502.1 tRNA threonylcarbamoyladenosine biosynthesis protein TsaB [Silvimonas terrae]